MRDGWDEVIPPWAPGVLRGSVFDFIAGTFLIKTIVKILSIALNLVIKEKNQHARAPAHSSTNVIFKY